MTWDSVQCCNLFLAALYCPYGIKSETEKGKAPAGVHRARREAPARQEHDQERVHPAGGPQLQRIHGLEAPGIVPELPYDTPHSKGSGHVHRIPA